MKIGISAEPHERGIRPELRYGLLAADCALSVAAVALATGVADIHSAGPEQLGLLALILFVTGSYAQFRYESARTFDFHDVLRLLSGAIVGAALAYICIWLLPSPLAHSSGPVGRRRGHVGVYDADVRSDRIGACSHQDSYASS